VVKHQPRKENRSKRAHTQKAGQKKSVRAVEEMNAALPEFYQTTQVVLLPVDPYLAYVYWEVTDEDLKRAKEALPQNHGGERASLRFFDLTDSVQNDKGPGTPFYVEVDLSARSMFVPLWSPGRTCKAELGMSAPGGRFYRLAGSNVAIPPSASEGDANARDIKVTEDFEIIEIPPHPVSGVISSAKAEPANAPSHARMPAAIQSHAAPSAPEASPDPTIGSLPEAPPDLTTGSLKIMDSKAQEAPAAMQQHPVLYPMSADLKVYLDQTSWYAERLNDGVFSHRQSRDKK